MAKKQILKYIFILVIIFLLGLPLSAQEPPAVSPQNSAQGNLLERRRQIQEDVQRRRAVMQQSIDQKRVQFQERIQVIQDQRKQQVVERINQRIQTIHSNQIQRMTSFLDTMTNILTRITVQSQELEANGVDVTSVNAAITEAETAILLAQETLTTQGQNSYILTIPEDETTLRSTIASLVDAFKRDIQILHESVKAAKNEVIEAVRALAAVQPANVMEESPMDTTIQEPESQDAAGGFPIN